MSAVSSSADLLDDDGGPENGETSAVTGDREDGPANGDMESLLASPLVEPGLLAAYGSCMQPVKCINWRQSIPKGFRKKFSLLKNLKVRTFADYLYSVQKLSYFYFFYFSVSDA